MYLNLGDDNLNRVVCYNIPQLGIFDAESPVDVGLTDYRLDFLVDWSPAPAGVAGSATRGAVHVLVEPFGHCVVLNHLDAGGL
jgi:hypothetical protein